MKRQQLVNDVGIHLDPEKLEFGGHGYGSVAILKIAEHEGHWFKAISMQLPLEGYGYGVSVKRNPYPDRLSALEAAQQEAIDWLQERIDSNRLNMNHRMLAEKTIQEIEESKQLSLF